MRLAITDICVEKNGGKFFVALRDDQACKVIGPMSERTAHKVHADLIDAVFSACLEQAALMKHDEARRAA